MTLFGKDPKSARLLRELNDIGIALSKEKNFDHLLELILEKAKTLSNADNGTLYLLNENDRLKFSIMQSKSLNIKLGGSTGKLIPFAPIKLYTKAGNPNNRQLAAHAALTKHSINVKDIYTSKEFDFSGTKAFDKRKSYRSVSALAVPLLSSKGQTLGVLHLVNAHSTRGKIIPFSDDVQHFVESLASQAAVAIENQQLIEEQEALLDGIIQMIAYAIDAKSEHTSNHCQAIPEIVDIIAKEACAQTDGYFADFDLSKEEWHALKVAAWLHDCGKLTTPVHLLDKATKLEIVMDAIEVIKVKAEIIARDYYIQYLQGQRTANDYNDAIAQLKNDLRFLRDLNKGTETVSTAKLERLQSIASLTYISHLSDSDKELNFLSKMESENLSIRKGTLNKHERAVINQHMEVTINMLESLPLPRHLKNVPEYAGGHHEKMDGTGFPKGLTRDEMSIPARIMAIADIFEALTSADRPYKKPKKLSEVLAIMDKLQAINHIDPDIYQLFKEQKLYLKYARKFLRPDQIDFPASRKATHATKEEKTALVT